MDRSVQVNPVQRIKTTQHRKFVAHFDFAFSTAFFFFFGLTRIVSLFFSRQLQLIELSYVGSHSKVGDSIVGLRRNMPLSTTPDEVVSHLLAFSSVPVNFFSLHNCLSDYSCRHDHTSYTIILSPRLSGDKSKPKGIKSRGFDPKIYSHLKPRANNLMNI